MRGPSRRDIGHGNLAERALIPVLPSNEDFPYVIRLVSECMSSNGSTSMASTCGSTLALMDAGVPISAPVAGAAMGLISEPDGRFVVLTDILGKEDSVGDMDFKVTGTRDGITALQMDIKVQGINEAIIRDGLKQALAARLEILDKMTEVMPEARQEMSDFAPRITTIKINPEKIREIIGKGGSMIRKIQEETSTEINVEDDGTVEIAAVSGENARKAINWIESLTRDVEIGSLYLGKVTRIMGFGAFVEILPGQGRPGPHRRAGRLPRPDRRGRRRRRRRGHGRRDRGRPPGSDQPLAQGRDAAPPGEGSGRLGPSRDSTTSRRATGGSFDSGLRPDGSSEPVRRAQARVREARCYTPAVPDPATGRAEPRRTMNLHPLTVAVVGATGVVGRTMIQILNEREFPVGELRLLASGRSAGRTVSIDGRTLEIAEAVPDAFEGVDVALFSAGADISKELAPAAVARGATVIDNSSAWRMDPTIPLVVSQVNPDDLEGHPGIVANPNCSTMQMAPVLMALRDTVGLERVVVDTYQSVSGTGADALAELETQVRAHVAGEAPVASVYPHPIAFNALPEIDVFLDNGYTKEEWKVVSENRKILGLPELRISCTAVRIPVFVSHSEAIHVETREPITPERARALFAAVPGVIVQDDPAEHRYPLATEAAGRDEIFVGRIRRDISIADDRGIAFWVVSDNLRKGAATNAVEIAEVLRERDWIRPAAARGARPYRAPGATDSQEATEATA